MSDKKNDEYQFEDDLYDVVDDDEATEEADFQEVDEDLFEPKNEHLAAFVEKVKKAVKENIRATIVLVVVVVGVLFYQLFSSDLKHPDPNNPTQLTKTPTSEKSTGPTQAQVDAWGRQMNEKLHRQGRQSQQFSQSIASKVSNQREELGRLSNKLRSLVVITNKNAGDIQSVMDHLDSISGQISKVSAALVALQKSRQPVKVVRKKHNRPSIQYVLRSVEPGRAWLLGSNHKMVTVTVGDKIPNYGQVVLIDAQGGVVVTDKGKQITFPPQRMAG